MRVKLFVPFRSVLSKGFHIDPLGNGKFDVGNELLRRNQECMKNSRGEMEVNEGAVR